MAFIVLSTPGCIAQIYKVRETITLKEVLDWMDTDAPFSMAFVTDDPKRDRGGEWVEIEQARKHEWLTMAQSRKLEKAQPTDGKVKRNPNHYENSTRNFVLPNGEIRKVAIRLIRRFNGKVVM